MGNSRFHTEDGCMESDVIRYWYLKAKYMVLKVRYLKLCIQMFEDHTGLLMMEADSLLLRAQACELGYQRLRILQS